MKESINKRKTKTKNEFNFIINDFFAKDGMSKKTIIESYIINNAFNLL